MRRRDAKDILALETELAKVQWTKVENRDPVKTYNKVEFAKLAGLAPGYDWKAYLADAGVDGKTDYLMISQPSYITGFNNLLQQTPLPVWKAYFRWHLLSDYAPYLSKSFVDEHFAFYGTALRGMPRERAALEARRRGGRGLDRRGARQALRRQVLSARVQGAHGPAGEEPARGLQGRHRHARLDEPGDQEEGAGQARQVQAPRSAIRQVARLHARCRSSRATWSAT